MRDQSGPGAALARRLISALPVPTEPRVLAREIAEISAPASPTCSIDTVWAARIQKPKPSPRFATVVSIIRRLLRTSDELARSRWRVAATSADRGITTAGVSVAVGRGSESAAAVGMGERAGKAGRGLRLRPPCPSMHQHPPGGHRAGAPAAGGPAPGPAAEATMPG